MLRNFGAHAFGIALFITALAAASPARADVTGTVRGSVLRSNGTPVAAAAVRLSGERVTLDTKTDERGRFAFVRVPFGHYELRAAAEALAVTAGVDVSSGAVIDVALTAASRIGSTTATTTGVRGAPVSETAYSARRLAALPRNDRLDAIVETAPGIVRFSFDEPVAHGFHGITYELDGAPLPQTSSSAFAQLVDPQNAAAVEIFTGAFPAEFGGSRQGAVVNIISGAGDLGSGRGTFTLGMGTQNAADVRAARAFTVGSANVALAVSSERTDRRLDTPVRDAIHDDGSNTAQFLRIAVPLSARTALAADVSNAYASFAIPTVSAGSGDVQREYDRFIALALTRTAADGNGYLRLVPWLRANRVAYDGDAALPDGVRQDRAATTIGVRGSWFHAGEHHALKAGLDVQRTALHSDVVIRSAGQPDFVDRATPFGSQTGMYVEDRWSPSRAVAVNAGLRYDRSSGYVGGSQLSPRLEINAEAGRGTILHAYAGRLYAAPGLEDTRRDAVVTGAGATADPVFDLRPERDTYVELGVAHAFGGVRATFNAFDRTAVNVLDTTQLAGTPLLAVFNNAVGRDRGFELRLDAHSARADAGLSLTTSRAEAGGVSGGTFLVAPEDAANLTLQPEDHDQRWTANAVYTRRFGASLRTFATLQAEYGTGFPVQFQNGNGRLPAHWIVDAALGRAAENGRLGWRFDVDNALDHRYPIKINNGFNTTQWNAPRRIAFRLTAPW